MTTTFKTPCSNSCLCARGNSSATKIFNARLEYEAGGQKHKEDIILVVPQEAHIGSIMQIMNCAVRDHIKPKGSSYGYLRFRLDGRSADLTFWQWVQDQWYRLTLRGKQHTGSHFVPIWPDPPPHWPRSATASSSV